jgi:hypothetical protein
MVVKHVEFRSVAYFEWDFGNWIEIETPNGLETVLKTGLKPGLITANRLKTNNQSD